MDDATLFERASDALRSFFVAQAGACDRAELIQRAGVVAVMNPHIPERSLWNGVSYDDAAALEAAVRELAGAYQRAGVRAWTVWVPPEDEGTARTLEREGHVLDAEPMAMARELDGIERPPGALADWTADGDLAEVGRTVLIEADTAAITQPTATGLPYSTTPPSELATTTSTTAVAIPYFQWDNRDGRAMRVWLPLA
jgi:hypothetical protein